MGAAEDASDGIHSGGSWDTEGAGPAASVDEAGCVSTAALTKASTALALLLPFILNLGTTGASQIPRTFSS
jgi:hypothetical protein